MDQKIVFVFQRDGRYHFRHISGGCATVSKRSLRNRAAYVLSRKRPLPADRESGPSARHDALHGPGDGHVGAWTVRFAVEIGGVYGLAQPGDGGLVESRDVLGARAILAAVGRPIIIERGELRAD